MKEIKNTRTIEEIVGYEAVDGTRFDSKEECEKYDKTAKAVIVSEFKKRIVRDMEVSDFTKYGEIPFTECGEEWYVAHVKIKNQEDLKACNMFCQLVRGESYFTDDMIGKDLLVSIGYGSRDGRRDYDICWVYGTVEDCVNQYLNALMSIIKTPEETENNGN